MFKFYNLKKHWDCIFHAGVICCINFTKNRISDDFLLVKGNFQNTMVLGRGPPLHTKIIFIQSLKTPSFCWHYVNKCWHLHFYIFHKLQKKQQENNVRYQLTALHSGRQWWTHQNPEKLIISISLNPISPSTIYFSFLAWEVILLSAVMSLLPRWHSCF